MVASLPGKALTCSTLDLGFVLRRVVATSPKKVQNPVFFGDGGTKLIPITTFGLCFFLISFL